MMSSCWKNEGLNGSSGLHEAHREFYIFDIGALIDMKRGLLSKVHRVVMKREQQAIQGLKCSSIELQT